MPQAISDMALYDLEQMLNQRKKKILELAKQRDKLRAELESIELELESLGGSDISKTKYVRRTRVRNNMSLRDSVIAVLEDNPKGLKIGEIREKVLESGYKTNSADFGNVLYQCLYNNSKTFRRDEKTGNYKYTPKPARKKS